MKTKRELAKELLVGLVEAADIGLRLEYVEAFIANVRAEERDACADIADVSEDKYAKYAASNLGQVRIHFMEMSEVAERISDAIRARKDGDS